MEVVARTKDGPDGKRNYLVEMTEIEIDKVSGIANKPHNSGRYRAGKIINVSRTYSRLSKIVERMEEIKVNMQEVRQAAQLIEDNLPIIEET